MAKTRFTGVVHSDLYSGLTSILGKSVTTYPLREVQHPQEGQSETLDVLSGDNMTINLDVAFRWRINRESAHTLFLEVGRWNEVREFVYNAYRSAVRDGASEVTAADLLSSERQGIGTRIRDLLVARLESRGIVVTEVFVRGIDPPQAMKTAIEEKLAREQQVQAEVFQTQVVTEQANQRRAEAQGIRDAQGIIATSLDGERGTRYLYWRYLEMLGEIGRGSNNMVIAPTEGGIPIFLGQGGNR